MSSIFAKKTNTEANENMDKALLSADASNFLLRNGLSPVARSNDIEQANQMYNHISWLQGDCWDSHERPDGVSDAGMHDARHSKVREIFNELIRL